MEASGFGIRRGLAGALMICALASCDNVEWGGSSFEWRPPPPKEVVVPEVAEEVEEALPPLPEGPVLFLARRDRDGPWSLSPIAEVAEDGLRPLSSEQDVPGFTARYVSERLVEGREFTLFEGSSRLGRFVAGSEVRPDSSYCVVRPSVAGWVEVLPEAADRTQFLALASDAVPSLERSVPATPEPDRGHSITSFRMVEQILNARRYRWPPDVASARASLVTVPGSDGNGALILSTYLFRDVLAVGPAPENAYSLFVLAESEGGTYAPTFDLYRNVGEDGKGAPRYLTRGDWDGDGREEILLDVFGADSRWLAALDRQDNGRWTVSFEDACPSPSPRGVSEP